VREVKVVILEIRRTTCFRQLAGTTCDGRSGRISSFPTQNKDILSKEPMKEDVEA